MKPQTVFRVLVVLATSALALLVLLRLRDASSLDLFVTRTVSGWRSPLLTTLFRFITELGSVLVGLIWSVLALRHSRRLGIGIAIAAIAGWLAVEALKNLFALPRPIEILPLVSASSYSFPSGHVGVAAATYGTLAALVYRHSANRWQGVCVIAGAVGVVGLVALSRIYLGVHYLTDVLAGAIVGGLVAAAIVRSEATAD